MFQLPRFRPRLFEVLGQYDAVRLRNDLLAGITVGVLALPLAIAFAIASGMPPESGIFTAVIAGFIISTLGGSRVQIGGPTGAFIVIVYGIVIQYGVANLLICTLMAGVMLLAMLDPLHPGIGHQRFHQGHCRADPAVADQGLPRSDHRSTAGGFFCADRRALERPAHHQLARGRAGRRLPAADRAVAAEMAHRAGTGGGTRSGHRRGCAVRPAGRNHRFAVRRNPAGIAFIRAARAQRGNHAAPGVAGDRHRAAGRDRIAAVRHGRRQHDR